MASFPAISSKKLLSNLKKACFDIIRINGSHQRFNNRDGRITTIPVHGNADIPKGLLRKIFREDLELTPDEFAGLVEEFG